MSFKDEELSKYDVNAFGLQKGTGKGKRGFSFISHTITKSNVLDNLQ